MVTRDDAWPVDGDKPADFLVEGLQEALTSPFASYIFIANVCTLWVLGHRHLGFKIVSNDINTVARQRLDRVQLNQRSGR